MVYFTEKRFHYPGNKRTSKTEEPAAIGNFTSTHTGSKIKTQGFDGNYYKVQIDYQLLTPIILVLEGLKAGHIISKMIAFSQILRLISKLHGVFARTSITKGSPLHRHHNPPLLPACTARLRLGSIQDTEPYQPSRLADLKQSMETKKKVHNKW